MGKKGFYIINTVLTVVLCVLIFDQRFERSEAALAQRDYSGQYKFTNPILDYENVKMESTSLLYDHIKEKIENLKGKYGLTFDSIYFRDLDNGQWIGINEKEQFATASLIKTPILIAFLRQSEIQPDILYKSVTITEEDVAGAAHQDIKPQIAISAGETYTLLELAKRMIQQSDNVAMRVLVRHIDDKFRNGVFEAIGVTYNVDGDEIMVRVKDYAAFFRILFNASYLSRENSELALEILSDVEFKRGLVAGLPTSITVAHKFGERSYYVDDVATSRQLHDCGVIYYPQKPYILCVMTRGNDFEDQSAFIREVSKLFYTELEKKF
jgi:beta-lactamase class A